MIESVNLINYMIVLIPLTGITYFLGGTVLVSFSHEVEFNKSVIYSTFIYLIITFFLYMIDSISLLSLIIALLITESYIALYRYYYCRKYKILGYSK